MPKNYEATVSFDLNQFKSDLMGKIAEFAENKLNTFNPDISDDDRNELRISKSENAHRLYKEILEACTRAFIEGDDSASILKFIQTHLIGHTHPNHTRLFLEGEATKFWKDLVLEMARRAKVPISQPSGSHPDTTIIIDAVGGEIAEVTEADLSI